MAVAPEIFKAYDVRGLYGEQIDGDVAEQIGRAFVRVLAELGRQGRRASCASASGRDMRLTAPELGARYRAGMVAEGAHVLDAGMVGTEMLYFLVGSRDLDGGLMCTASHNPKAYTGAKLVRAGAIALVGRRGHPRHPPRRRGRPRRRRRAAARPRRSTSAPSSSEAALRFIDPAQRRAAEGRRRRRQRHGRPDGRPAARAPRPRPRDDLLGARRRFPDHEPNPLLEENRRFIVDKVRATGADLGIA